jgi:hypothetical protein
VVAHDDTVRAGATILQLPARIGGRSYAGRRVELHLQLDGRIVVWDGTREILAVAAPPDPVQLRALVAARVDLGEPPPSVTTSRSPAPHPWRRLTPGSRLARERLSESRSS